MIRKASGTNRSLVLIAMVLSMFMSAIEGTIVATAMPSIAAKLGGFSLYSWVFSSFLLMQAVSVPIFGKLADMLGRKPVFIAGVVIFLVGSILCGFAPSMGMLVAYRFLQGIGAGAVQPTITILAGDLFTLQERGRVQGYLSSVWGISSVIGPLAGGLIVEQAHWAWIFWMNVPFGLVAIALVLFFLHEDVKRAERRSIDLPGVALLLVSVSALMLALTEGAVWGLPAAAGLVALAAITLFLFIRQERRAADPVMHLELWRSRLIALGNIATLTGGIAMIGLISFLPTYVQGVLGNSALVAGFALSSMSIGWPIASFVAGRLFITQGVRRIVRIGGAVVIAGSLIVALMAGYGAIAAGAGSFMIGVGLGLLSTTFMVAIQSSVSWAQRGVATASNMLMRILGNALGAAIFGGVLNLRFRAFFAARGMETSLDSIQDLLGERAHHPGAALTSTLVPVRDALSESLIWVFWGIVIVAVITGVMSWMSPELAAREDAPAVDAGAAIGH